MLFERFSLMLLCSWYKLMEANYNKILGIQKCKQRAKNKIRTMCQIQNTCAERETKNPENISEINTSDNNAACEEENDPN